METSNAARYFILAVIFVSSMAIVIANLRNVLRMVLKKPVGRVQSRIWAILGLFLVFCIVDTFVIEPNWVTVEQHEIQTDKLADGAKIRIVQLSDLHLEQIGKRERRMLYLTAMQQPDIIVLTGDYLNYVNEARGAALLKEMGRRLSDIAPTYAVEGNWDCKEDMAHLASGGVTVLDDEWTEFKGKRGVSITLGGYLWLNMDKRPRCPEPLQDNYKVVACHISWLGNMHADDMDLALTGHTHGGQIRVPVFGALIPDQGTVGKHQKGFYPYNNGKLYVNSGIGMEGGAPQVRFCCRPVVAVFDIVGKKD